MMGSCPPVNRKMGSCPQSLPRQSQRGTLLLSNNREASMGDFGPGMVAVVAAWAFGYLVRAGWCVVTGRGDPALYALIALQLMLVAAPTMFLVGYFAERMVGR